VAQLAHPVHLARCPPQTDLVLDLDHQPAHEAQTVDAVAGVTAVHGASAAAAHAETVVVAVAVAAAAAVAAVAVAAVAVAVAVVVADLVVVLWVVLPSRAGDVVLLVVDVRAAMVERQANVEQ